MVIKLADKKKPVTLTFDRGEQIKLRASLYIYIDKNRAYVKNTFTDATHLFNENGFFIASNQRISKLKNTPGICVI